jgi:3-oxoacyl-[acyl-carrier protein] reductase
MVRAKQFTGKRLDGRVAIITGAGQGIGKATALAMAREGAAVVVNDCVPGAAENTVREIISIKGTALPFTGDITRFDVAGQLVQAAVTGFGRVDILMNNAGVFVSGKAWETTEEDWDRCVDVSLKGAFNCSRHACGIMKERGWGRIISASSAARLGQPEAGAYAAAKAGIVGLTISLAMELGQHGITCNAYSPVARTGMAFSEEALERHRRRYEAGWVTREFYEKMVNPPPPESVAPLIVYLATEEAAKINGQVFDIIGGDISIFSGPFEKTTIRKEDGLWTVEELIETVPGELLEKCVIRIM